MYELLGALADYKIRLIERLDHVADLDMVFYGDDWGTPDRLFLRPDTWRQIIRPHTERIYDAMKRRSLLSNQHSCGKIEAIFEDLVGGEEGGMGFLSETARCRLRSMPGFDSARHGPGWRGGCNWRRPTRS
jgi:hypothetical protein